MVVDRHGRARRADNDPRRRPSDGFRVPANRFRRVLFDAMSALPTQFRAPLRNARVVIEDVPAAPVLDDGGELVLAAFVDDVLTVYRRPAEYRAESRGELEEVLLVAVARAVATALGYEGDVEDWLE